jgi:hypothetical protein
MSIRSQVGEQLLPIQLTAASQLLINRFVKLTAGVPAYAGPGEIVFGVTRSIGDANDYRTIVHPLDQIDKTFFIRLGGTVAAHDPLFVSTSGVAKTSAYTFVDRSQADRPSPGADAVYIVPAGAWSTGGATANQIATYTHVGTVWAYADPTTGDVGYITEEARYVIYNGSAWVDAYPVAYACEEGVSGEEISAYVNGNTRVLTRKDLPSSIGANLLFKCAGSSTSENDADASVVITDGRILSTDKAMATIAAQAGTATILKAVCTAKTLTITLSGNGGAGTVINYMIFNSLDA